MVIGGHLYEFEYAPVDRFCEVESSGDRPAFQAMQTSSILVPRST